jgi:superfamily II DNA/RNA helicase
MLTLAHWATYELLKSEGLHAGFFTGAEGQRRRTQNIVEFHDDPSFRMLFATDAGGVGLNLQRAANCVVNLELPWNPAVLEQRIGRIYRLGQKQPIDVYNLVCEYGIESRIAGIVGSKQAFFKGLFDGDSDTIDFGQASNFLARVQKLYEPAASESVSATGNVGDLEADLADTELDDSVSDPLDELIEAGDESHDPVLAAAANGDTGQAISVDHGPGNGFAAESNEMSAKAAMPSSGEVRELFAQLKISRQAGGGVVIEAPAEAASTLGALFEGMAALLHNAVRSDR